MKKHLERLLDKLNKARFALAAAVAAEQQTCAHDDILECDYLPSDYGSSMPPMRVCCDCGMTEEGWGCGYVVLKGAPRSTPRADIYAKRLGFSVRDAHKGMLLRREATIAELIASGG